MQKVFVESVTLTTTNEKGFEIVGPLGLTRAIVTGEYSGANPFHPSDKPKTQGKLKTNYG